ncbi:MAG: acyl-CoA dehydrogenase family protein [Acidimicrobiia bacterium]
MTTTLVHDLGVLSDDMLERFAARAPVYDAENRFFTEDFEELRDAGYLLLAVPTELGGLGGSLAQVCAQQRRLARRAPATALAINMHLYWTGVAADLYRGGDRSLVWLLEEAVAGEVFASGHAEAGNDLALLMSTTRAEPVAGGYRYHGRKLFGSLSPVWTRLGLHGLDTSDPEAPVIVHGFLPRDAPGWSIVETWDTLGMRATRSDDTVLDGAFVPEAYVARSVPAGFAGTDAFVLGILGWGQATFASIYLGLAERALELTVDGVKRRTSLARGGQAMAQHPMVQHQVAEMVIEIESASAHVERIADDWSAGIDHGGAWPSKLAAVKHHVTTAAQRVVDVALEVTGGGAMFRGQELERLYRDVRCGGFHPANAALTYEIVGQTALGLLGTEPEWMPDLSVPT